MANEFIVKKGLISKGDVTVVSGSSIATDKLKARSSSGLFLVDDADNGIFVEDGGNVGIGTTQPAEKLDIDQGNIHVDHEPTSSGSATGGVIITATVDANATGFAAALHMDTDGNWIEADASSTATMPCQALAMETGTGSKKVLMQGFVKDTSWSWTIGGTLYVSATTGAMTQTAPSTTGEQVQAVGFATNTDKMYFNPDYTLVEIA